jgi:hypothetical protein
MTNDEGQMTNPTQKTKSETAICRTRQTGLIGERSALDYR